VRDLRGWFEASMNAEPSGRASERLYRHLLGSISTEIGVSELSRSAVVFSPHPDDESLGCGGTIIKKMKTGASVTLVHMTDGSAATHANLICKEELKAIRMGESQNAGRVLGLSQGDIYFLEFEDGKLMQHLSSATQRVAQILQDKQPEEVFVPYRGEPIYQAADHIATTKIVLKSLALSRLNTVVWEYPIWFWMHWPWIGLRQGERPIIRTWAVFRNSVIALFGIRALIDLRDSVHIGDVLEQKAAAIREHKSQLERLFPDPRWLTLGDISSGQFLELFHQEREFFRRYDSRI
jgi:LmbE family N-acetylglucosaminyl deacetylase